jgi:hypothetical protein
VADSELSGRQKGLVIAAALAGVPLFVGIVLTSGMVQWVLIAIGVALEASLALYGAAARRRD